jgi:hypothetical protein
MSVKEIVLSQVAELVKTAVTEAAKGNELVDVREVAGMYILIVKDEEVKPVDLQEEPVVEVVKQEAKSTRKGKR